MRSISVINFKGGVGKTTFTWLLGRYLAELGKKIILVDIDPQMSLTELLHSIPVLHSNIDNWLQLERMGKVLSLSEVMSLYEQKVISKVNEDKLVIPLPNSMCFIPSTPLYYKHQFEIKDQKGTRSTNFIKILFKAIKKSVPNLDYVLFDCPPGYTPLLHSVLNFSDVYLTPVNSDKFGHRSLEGFMDFISLLNLHNRKPIPPKKCIFPNRVVKVGGKVTKDDILELKRIELFAEKNDAIFTNTRIYEQAAIAKSIKNYDLSDEQIGLINPLWAEIESKCW